jgi:hypothetical protein
MIYVYKHGPILKIKDKGWFLNFGWPVSPPQSTEFWSWELVIGDIISDRKATPEEVKLLIRINPWLKPYIEPEFKYRMITWGVP